MFRRIMLTVLLAGGLAGTVSFGLQTWKLFPLILEAEVYEESAAAHGHPGMAHERAVHDGAALERYAAESEEWTPGNGMERISYSLLADLLTSIGFAALLVGAIALSGREVGSREGLLWGDRPSDLVGGHRRCECRSHCSGGVCPPLMAEGNWGGGTGRAAPCHRRPTGSGRRGRTTRTAGTFHHCLDGDCRCFLDGAWRPCRHFLPASEQAARETRWLRGKDRLKDSRGSGEILVGQDI
ncbi:MAG: hypothetical protein FD153_1740 [Rhodospirillaceae bacterium]|nr:MAG: hypothetical protein FD153_1740 [Rhodospirillaceae bacterium]